MLYYKFAYLYKTDEDKLKANWNIITNKHEWKSSHDGANILSRYELMIILSLLWEVSWKVTKNL